MYLCIMNNTNLQITINDLHLYYKNKYFFLAVKLMSSNLHLFLKFTI